MAKVVPCKLEISSNPMMFDGVVDSGMRLLGPLAVKRECLRIARSRLGFFWSDVVRVHEGNAAPLAENARLREQIVVLMREAQIPDRHDVLVETRPGRTKKVDEATGFRKDFERYLWIDDGFATARMTYEARLSEYALFETKLAEEERREMLERERALEDLRRKRKEDVEFAKLSAKYGVESCEDWVELADELAKRDQRLDLALAMRRTRANSGDGNYLVRDALRRFVVNSTQDKEIAISVLDALLVDDGLDGRVWRDCKWNYNELLASVGDDDLAHDFGLVMERDSNVS